MSTKRKRVSVVDPSVNSPVEKKVKKDQPFIPLSDPNENNPPTFVEVDSRLKSSGTNSDFTYEIFLPANHTFNRICCTSALIPRSFFSIPDGENTFVIIEDGAPIIVTLPPGNYTLSRFTTALITAINDVATWSYDVSWDELTNSWTFIVTGNSDQPIFVFITSLYEALGFDELSENAFVDDELVSTGMVDIGAKKRVYIRAPELVYNSDHRNGGVLACVNAIFPDYTFISYECHDVEGNARRMPRIASSGYRFIITDERGKLLNLHRKNVMFTLKFFRDENAANVDKYAVQS